VGNAERREGGGPYQCKGKGRKKEQVPARREQAKPITQKRKQGESKKGKKRSWRQETRKVYVERGMAQHKDKGKKEPAQKPKSGNKPIYREKNVGKRGVGRQRTAMVEKGG